MRAPRHTRTKRPSFVARLRHGVHSAGCSRGGPHGIKGLRLTRHSGVILPSQLGESETRACTAKTNRICQDTTIPVLALEGAASTDIVAGMGAFEMAGLSGGAQGDIVTAFDHGVCVADSTCTWAGEGTCREPFNLTPMVGKSISFGSPHVRPMWVPRTCSEPNEIERNTHPKNTTALFGEQVERSRT